MASIEGGKGLNVWKGFFAEERAQERPAPVPTPVPTEGKNSKSPLRIEDTSQTPLDAGQVTPRETPTTVVSFGDKSDLSLDQKIKQLQKPSGSQKTRSLRHKR